MEKKLKKIVYIVLIVVLAMMCFACKKKVKHKWIEVGANPNPVPVAPGVHPERGTDSNAVKVMLVPIYRPMGRDKDGKSQFKKYLFEMEGDIENLTPEALDAALKEVELIGEDSLFCDLQIMESDVVVSAGPGASDSMLTKKGVVRYVDLSSPLDNSDDYEGKVYPRDLEGMINQQDIENSITQTFEENFHLVSCDIELVTMEEYELIHGKK